MYVVFIFTKGSYASVNFIVPINRRIRRKTGGSCRRRIKRKPHTLNYALSEMEKAMVEANENRRNATTDFGALVSYPNADHRTIVISTPPSVYDILTRVV